MKDTTIAPHLLTIVREYGHNKAVAWLEGEEELAKPDDDLCSFLARHDVEFDRLPESDRDSIRDEYIEYVKTTMRQRLSNAPQIGQDASLTADSHPDPPSPEKPVVQTSGSDSVTRELIAAALNLDDCALSDNRGNDGGINPFHLSGGPRFKKAVFDYRKLNA